MKIGPVIIQRIMWIPIGVSVRGKPRNGWVTWSRLYSIPGLHWLALWLYD